MSEILKPALSTEKNLGSSYLANSSESKSQIQVLSIGSGIKRKGQQKRWPKGICKQGDGVDHAGLSMFPVICIPTSWLYLAGVNGFRCDLSDLLRDSEG